MTKKIDDILEEEGAAAEQYELQEKVVDHVEVSRPNLGKATVVSVRLSAGEHERLQRAADAIHLPVSTFLRVSALSHLDAGKDSGSVGERLARLEQAVFDRSA
jgi:hypothetical protein